VYILQFDGMLHQPTGQNEKAGLLGYGWLVTNNESQVAHGFGLFAHSCMANSNIAEYLALIEGLDALADLRIWKEPIEIRGDAKCVIDQMKGMASISSPPTRKLSSRARRLANQFANLTWVWVPRKKNKPADKLSRRGLHQLHVIPHAYENALNQLTNHPMHGGGLIPVVDLRVYTPSES
jgi:ribonuclease HI